eukprot:TRINITY_DN10432_c0_g1_i1.p1 TRINITY_DN10432_c0_g1~~TRINITY_DN10432_c0_g1_i1.p1  ORF type:complete len:453 (-),score=203.96 TRINITY_DN10432_c0_g1_i1:54-1388(-)
MEKAAKKGDAAALKKLITSGASVIGADKEGNTLLHLAAKSGSLDASKLLLDAGCDSFQRNAKGQTALDIAEKKKSKNLITLFRTVIQQQNLGIGAKGPAAPRAAPTSSSLTWDVVMSSQVSVYKYDQGASSWVQVDGDSQLLELHNCPHPFAYKIVMKRTGFPNIEIQLTKDFQYSKATETFHNFHQEGFGVWGFNFLEESEAPIFDRLMEEEAKEKLKNPPPPPQAAAPIPVSISSPPPAAPAAPAAPPAPSSSSSSAPPSGGGPPPPPPPPAPSPSSSPSAPRASAGLSLADQLANKSSGLKASTSANAIDFASEDIPSPTPAQAPARSAPVSSGAGGGNVMSELANRLKKRQDGAAAPAPSGGSAADSHAHAPSSGSSNVVHAPLRKTTNTIASSSAAAHHGPSNDDFEAFKKALVDGFRNDLRSIKKEIIDAIHQSQAVQ